MAIVLAKGPTTNSAGDILARLLIKIGGRKLRSVIFRSTIFMADVVREPEECLSWKLEQLALSRGCHMKTPRIPYKNEAN